MAYGRRTTRRTYRKRGVRKTTPFKRVNTRKMVARAKTRSLVKLIKGVSLKQSETCYKTISISHASFQHNGINALALWDVGGSTALFPSQGNSDGERRGDEIYTQGIMCRMIFQVPHDRRNMTFKMWYLPLNASQGPLVYANFFHNVSGNNQLDPIQSDRWGGIRYLGRFRCRSVDQNTDAANPEDKTILVKRWIPMRKKLKFINDGSTIPSNIKDRGYIVICAYDTINTLTTDNVMTAAQSTFTLYYKDP